MLIKRVSDCCSPAYPRKVRWATLDEEIEFETYIGAFAIFDLECLVSKIGSDHYESWILADDFHKIPEVQQGIVTLVRLGNVGQYLLRITSKTLPQSELAKYTCMPEIVGVEVRSGLLSIGKIETLPIPGNAVGVTRDEGEGGILTVPNGKYDLSIYAPNADDNVAISKIIVHIRKRIQNFSPLQSEPRIFC